MTNPSENGGGAATTAKNEYSPVALRDPLFKYAIGNMRISTRNKFNRDLQDLQKRALLDMWNSAGSELNCVSSPARDRTSARTKGLRIPTAVKDAVEAHYLKMSGVMGRLARYIERDDLEGLGIKVWGRGGDKFLARSFVELQDELIMLVSFTLATGKAGGAYQPGKLIATKLAYDVLQAFDVSKGSACRFAAARLMHGVPERPPLAETKEIVDGLRHYRGRVAREEADRRTEIESLERENGQE